ncbi:MAG: isocitrate dehydrogenase kinase/phosphatase AceK regulatory subunit [Bryobacteraceae bacterium]
MRASSNSRAASRHPRRHILPAGQNAPLPSLPPAVQTQACRAAELIFNAHNAYLSEFNELTAKARDAFEYRAWTQGAIDAGRRVQLYREAVNGIWYRLQRSFPEHSSVRDFWMSARQFFIERVIDTYDADLAMTFFYSTMRIAFDAHDVPVEYADDGLVERSHIRSPYPVCRSYRVTPQSLSRAIRKLFDDCEFRSRLENPERDAALVAARLLADWSHTSPGPPRTLQMLKTVMFRDQEAYLAGKLRASPRELPVVLALRHEPKGITVDAVLTGKEDMRNILFVSTRSTFHVPTTAYREVLSFLDSLAPERGHPAMCAVLGFTHPARVALNQRLHQHLRDTNERFSPVPGRVGMAMIVFAPPTFPYVFKVIRDFSSKPGWLGRAHIMELYRWVHEMNRGRLMLDAWVYRNLHFPKLAFDGQVLDELFRSAPSSVRLDGDRVVLKHVYAQRRVQPLSTFLDQNRDRGSRERAIHALGLFIKDLAAMGFFIGDCYGLPFNTGLTHSSNVALFDFDDLGPILRYRFRQTPPLADERDEFLWNSETDGAWFRVDENDVLVDEWERYLGVPPDLDEYFRQKHGDLFTVEYWSEVQERIMAGKLHFIRPYPAERTLEKTA